MWECDLVSARRDRPRFWELAEVSFLRVEKKQTLLWRDEARYPIL